MEKIKIGEIKAHSIMLLFPDLELSYDRDSEQSLKGMIENLKCDPNIRDIVLSLTPSINRAFSLIEKRGASKTKSKEAYVSRKGRGGMLVKLSEIASDVYSVCRVYTKSGKQIMLEHSTDDEIYLSTQEAAEYTFVYKSKLRRISEATNDFDEVDLSEGVAEIIPYFVKSEIIYSEDKEASNASRILFDGILSELCSLPASMPPEVESIYYIE